MGPWTQLVWTSANWYIQINKSLVGLFNSIWTHSDPNHTEPPPRQWKHMTSNKSQGQVRLPWRESWARTLLKSLIKSFFSPVNVLGHQAVFLHSLTCEFYAAVRHEILCSQNLSFLISRFFPNYFQINFQLIHKDEIWHVTYTPKHVVILLPIFWFHGGFNKHHMWSTVFLCINMA